MGALETGKSYDITNVSTREFGGDLYLTATRSTGMKEVAALCGPGLNLPFTVDEGDITTVTAQINGAQVSVHRSCVKCYAWQADFDAKVNFHCYMRCGLLQKIGSFQPSVTAKISVLGDFGEDEFKLSNSVLKNHLEQRFSIPVLAPPRSAYIACLS